MIKEIKTICEEEDENSKDMPLFLFAGDYISITGKALPEFAPKSWYPFLEKLREHVLTVNKIQVDFKEGVRCKSVRFIWIWMAFCVTLNAVILNGTMSCLVLCVTAKNSIRTGTILS
jgi:hypothetical protein